MSNLFTRATKQLAASAMFDCRLLFVRRQSNKTDTEARLSVGGTQFYRVFEPRVYRASQSTAGSL